MSDIKRMQHVQESRRAEVYRGQLEWAIDKSERTVKGGESST